MFGLDKKFIDKIDYELAISRILHDVSSDFIIAPHYSSVFENAKSALWNLLKTQLNGGKYNPFLPLIIEVPKKSGLTRPGSILNPIDRLFFQSLIDLIIADIECGIDRKKVYSNEYDVLSDTPEKLFVPVSKKYNELREKISKYCESFLYNYALVTDIACYFERIYQHVLINILRSTNIEPELISVVEKVLSAHTAKDSHGIVQGIYPSDVLGNYYLTAFDAYLSTNNIEFVRFVDDYWMFFNTEKDATKALINICKYVRKEGLYLNEPKTKILSTDELHYEETEIDRLFEAAKSELSKYGIDSFGYSFDPFDLEELEEEVEMNALQDLYTMRFENPNMIDKIDKFCLPRFALAKNIFAIEEALEGLESHPHLTSIYIRYLKSQIESDKVLNRLEDIFLKEKLKYDWQNMWILGMFYSVESVSKHVPMQAYSILEDNNKSEVIRAICALVASKHGDGPIRRLIRNRYSSEPSSYVKEAILYSTKHFPSSDDRRACVKAWEGHSEMNKLIVKAMKNEV